MPCGQQPTTSGCPVQKGVIRGVGDERERDSDSGHVCCWRSTIVISTTCMFCRAPPRCAGGWLIVEPLGQVVRGIAIAAEIEGFLQHLPSSLSCVRRWRVVTYERICPLNFYLSMRICVANENFLTVPDHCLGRLAYLCANPLCWRPQPQLYVQRRQQKNHECWCWPVAICRYAAA